MGSTETMDTPSYYDSAPLLAVEAEILYEDFATGLRAHLLLDRVRQCLGHGIQANEHLWRFDLLREPELLKEAVEEAVQADLVIVSAHGDGVLPEPLKDWAGEWLLRAGQDVPGVVLALDSRLQRPAAKPPFVDAFRRLLAERSTDMFLCFYDPPIARELSRRHHMADRLRGPLASPGDSENW